MSSVRVIGSSLAILDFIIANRFVVLTVNTQIIIESNKIMIFLKTKSTPLMGITAGVFYLLSIIFGF